MRDNCATVKKRSKVMIIITLLQYKSRSTSLNIRFVDWLMSFSSLLLVVLLAAGL